LSFVPLTQAVTSGDASEVSALLANGADVNERTGGGQTPLILATIFGHTHLISLLLDAGADPQLRDNLGLNAVDWAQRRGATEAIDVLTNKRNHSLGNRVERRFANLPAREAPSAEEAEAEKPKAMSEAEKSQRWLSGLKQRIAEESERASVSPVLPPAPQPEPAPQPRITAIEPESPPSPKRKTRKRCPKCNAIYNSDLLAYCAHHVVELVDADASPIISGPSKNSNALFWMIIVMTLTGSIVVGSIITALFYNTNKAAPSTATPRSQPTAVQRGTPSVDSELEGKYVSLPTAECPLNGQEAIPGTVVVHVVIDKSGQVKSARASGGDWLLRGAAHEAAMKSTFASEKLRGRETEGTITYTFEP
jgi:ankyrin repeat protein